MEQEKKFVDVLSTIRSLDKFKNKFICANCGKKGTKNELKGSGAGCLIAIVLFITIIGILFIPFIWGKKKCPKCGSTNVVPLDTPRGQKLLSEYYENKES
ncbi:MAG: hypothetical protein LBU55_05200 [Elusimicrobiota bacterium]|jgi:predicted RNA-binding Zn-ribbon protein involved in translation (DUF1610 family)|nr:hypothetical protein [Elusimicrobiota bacterium]